MSTILNNKDVQMLNDIESDNCSSLSNTMNNNINDIESVNCQYSSNHENQIITFRYSSNKLLYILLISLGTLIAFLCISLQTTTMIPTNDKVIARHLLSGTPSSSEIQQMMQASSEMNVNKEVNDADSMENNSDPELLDTFTKFTQLIDDIRANPDSKQHQLWNKVLGLLIGSAIGDSLGAPLEFWFDFLGDTDFPLEPYTLGRYIGEHVYQVAKTKDIDPQQLYLDEVIPAAMKMEGGGWNRFKPGATTDDTAMSMQLARALIKSSISQLDKAFVTVRAIQENILESYREWANPNPDYKDPDKTLKYDETGLRIRPTPFDIGITTRDVLTSGITNLDKILEMTANKNKEMRDMFGNGVWSNGALMRSYPLAIYCLELSMDDCFEVVAADVALTNNNPTVQTVVTTYVLITRELLKGSTPHKAVNDVKSWLTKRRDQNDYDIDYMGYKNRDKKEEGMIEQTPASKVLEWIAKSKQDPVKASGAGPIGLMTIGFEKSIYYLLQPTTKKSFEDVMKEIFTEKGDTDTNGAIVGGILGARDGIIHLYEKYPDWIQKILECTVDPHPVPLRSDPRNPGMKFVDADFNPYLARHYIEDNIWQDLITAAPKRLSVAPQTVEKSAPAQRKRRHTHAHVQKKQEGQDAGDSNPKPEGSGKRKRDRSQTTIDRVRSQE